MNVRAAVRIKPNWLLVEGNHSERYAREHALPQHSHSDVLVEPDPDPGDDICPRHFIQNTNSSSCEPPFEPPPVQEARADDGHDAREAILFTMCLNAFLDYLRLFR